MSGHPSEQASGFRVIDHGQVPYVRGVVAGVMPVVGTCHGLTVVDDQSMTICQFFAHPDYEVDVYARRIAELLNRHGLVDVPDTIEEDA